MFDSGFDKLNHRNGRVLNETPKWSLSLSK